MLKSLGVGSAKYASATSQRPLTVSSQRSIANVAKPATPPPPNEGPPPKRSAPPTPRSTWLDADAELPGRGSGGGVSKGDAFATATGCGGKTNRASAVLSSSATSLTWRVATRPSLVVISKSTREPLGRTVTRAHLSRSLRLLRCWASSAVAVCQFSPGGTSTLTLGARHESAVAALPGTPNASAAKPSPKAATLGETANMTINLL